jgi:hypothetical protein
MNPILSFENLKFQKGLPSESTSIYNLQPTAPMLRARRSPALESNPSEMPYNDKIPHYGIRWMGPMRTELARGSKDLSAPLDLETKDEFDVTLQSSF